MTLVLLAFAWFIGNNLADATDESRATLTGYIAHAFVGGTILILTVVRLFCCIKEGSPPALSETFIDKVAKGIIYAFYFVLFVLPVSGMVTIITSDAWKAILAGDANMLPKENGYETIFIHNLHEILVTVLIVLVALHLLGAIKHQFIMKDGLMKRMMLHNKD